MPVAWIYHSRGVQGLSARLRNVVMDLRGEMVDARALGDRAEPMILLLSTSALDERAAVASGPLKSLAESLAGDLEPLLTRDLYIPADKALLSRQGGRCARDGTLLAFDPFTPHEHRCPVCGDVYRGELHDRFWIYWYQLWLAERAVHAAALFGSASIARFGALATAILDGYAERYASYPNVDNVLGPTRLFFSTYLESIWLLQIAIATDLMDDVDRRAHRARARPHHRAESRDHRGVRRGRIEPAGLERCGAARSKSAPRRFARRRAAVLGTVGHRRAP